PLVFSISSHPYDPELISFPTRRSSDLKYSYLIVEKGFAKRLKNLQRALGLLLAVELDIKIIKNLPRSYFHPTPKVDSVLIVLKRHHPLIAKKDYPLYKKFVYKWV